MATVSQMPGKEGELSQASSVTCREECQYYGSLRYLELPVPVQKEPAAHPVPPELAVLGPGRGGAVLQPAVDHTDEPHVPRCHLPDEPRQGEAHGRPVSTEEGEGLLPGPPGRGQDCCLGRV